jgi:large subunit ribosomal protein L5
MHFLEFYYNKIIQYDLINKFNYTTIKKVPKLKKIVLNFKTKNFKTKTFAATLLALELITTKKCIYSKSKKPNIFLKIQKGQPIGGKVILKKKTMYHFLSIFLVEIMSKTKNLKKLKSNNSTFSMQLNNNELNFTNFNDYYNLSELLPYITVTVLTTAQTKPELFFLLRSFQYKIKY